ncbi:MAG: EAL domain-containing protein [Pseudomonadota bacterium]|nr:EAL domain-containing protein [Pseudomonadota bacterium]MDP1904095.1 EAL domain-containing protein [Pseudomonadota bacterium]MDP2354210.1 EAL domain-containing protein [Pseudomonadota bacterium]
MKPQSIARLASLFILAVAGFILMMGGYLWLEIERVSKEIQAREAHSARVEVVEGLAEMRRRALDMAQTLALWDETRQQLAFSEYYTLWRDDRVRDAGMVSNRVEGVALYDKRGRILAPAHKDRPMLSELPGRAPLALLQQDRDGGHFSLFLPVYADPEGQILLGHVGIKFNFLAELRRARTYQFADLEHLRVTLTAGSSIDLERAGDHLSFATRSNPDLAAFHDLFRASLLRLVIVVLVLLFLAAVLLVRLLVRPLRAFSLEIDALREPGGSLPQQPAQASPLPILELDNMRRSFNDYQARLAELHTNLEQNSRDFHDQARRDALTGSYNRRAFDEDWKTLGEDRRLGRVALLLFDCDHFKAINDTYGHQVGDVVIQTIAGALHTALRANDRLYRLGGDEFATILRDADAHRAEMVAERCIEHVLSQDFRQYGLSEPTTISIGIALSEGEGISLHELQKRADLAMYTAKRPGSRKLVFYSEDMGGMAALVGNREISAVFQAIENPDLIELHYQSVMRLPMSTKEYVEALTRIRFEGELIGPDAIFPIVQARNLDMEFDLAVLRALDRDLTQNRLPAGQGVSVNLSAPSVVNSKVVDALTAIIRAHPGRKIVAEITETALITQIDVASDNIRRLRDAGCLVALDDFGSGYSSLRYLASMPVDLVKFDISMVHLLESGDRRQQLMMEDISSLVVTAGYQMVAEGVETRELLDKVIGLGFSHAQGYYFDRPQAPE